MLRKHWTAPKRTLKRHGYRINPAQPQFPLPMFRFLLQTFHFLLSTFHFPLSIMLLPDTA